LRALRDRPYLLLAVLTIHMTLLSLGAPILIAEVLTRAPSRHRAVADRQHRARGLFQVRAGRGADTIAGVVATVSRRRTCRCSGSVFGLQQVSAPIVVAAVVVSGASGWFALGVFLVVIGLAVPRSVHHAAARGRRRRARFGGGSALCRT
jgi:hypothetical protein